MYKIALFFLMSVRCVYGLQVIRPSNLTVANRVVKDEDHEDGKSSLVFVFDTTGSMYNDLRQLREGAEMILNTALQESDVIADFVFVPFHDPTVGPATVTKDKNIFKAALNVARVYGGGDCPEKSLGGIQLALNVSRPRSYVYVFTDATASDHRLVGKVLDMIQRKQSQVVFVLTGHCNDLHKPSYKVYQQIAAASSGQVFNLNKTNVHMVLDFVRSSIKGRTVNLASAVRPAGYNYTQGIQVDKTIGEVTVSVSGARPRIEVVSPRGERLAGPPRLVTTLDLSEIMIVKVLEPEPGHWSITVGSEREYSVKVVGLSDLTFDHGFSVVKPTSPLETSYRPLQGTYNHMMISLSKTDLPVKFEYAEILNLEGKTIFEVPLVETDSEKKVYLADAFVPPDDFFYIAINGHDDQGQELRRVASTAVQSKPADVPYLLAPQKVRARRHERVALSCGVESLVPVTAAWTRGGRRLRGQASSVQSTWVEHVIEDVGEADAGVYRCVATNVAGASAASTLLEIVVEPPRVSVLPANATLAAGEPLVVSCAVASEERLIKAQIVFSNSQRQNLTEFHLEPTPDGVYSFNTTIQRVSDGDGGKYSCVAANRGGQSKQSTYVTIQSHPLVQILGPHSLVKRLHSGVQLVCHVERADTVRWLRPDGGVALESEVNGTFDAMLDVKNVTGDGNWTCVGFRGSYRATDAIELSVVMKPVVTLEGERNVTVLNGTVYRAACAVVARPAPRIVWHRETEAFLNHTVTAVGGDVYRSVLTLDSSREQINGTYFCFGENSEGIGQDSVTIDVRRPMVLLEGFHDQSVELYSQVELHCLVDCHPPARVSWYHNGTARMTEDHSVLFIQKVDFDSLGLYTCVADNAYERLEVNGSLTVHGLESPALSKEPGTKKARKGSSATLTCRVLKGNPEPTVSWEFRSDSSANFTALPKGVTEREERNEIEISDVRVEHTGVYRCKAENAVGRDVYTVTLMVQFPPQLVPTNESQLVAPLEVREGDKKVLSCAAEGQPPPIVTWSKFLLPISFSNNVHLTDNNDLVIEAATDFDSGVYTCRAANALGTARRDFTLLVYSPPVIPPPGIGPELDVVEGQLVELPCAAAGAPPPRAHWLHNGAPLAALPASRHYVDEYGLRFVANLTDFGEYTCLATNPYGNASITYNVYVWVPPHILGPMYENKNVLIGSNLTLTCDAVGFPVPTIMWEFEEQLLTENSSRIQFDSIGNLVIRGARGEQQGVYACVAENMVGARRRYTRLRIDVPPTIISDNYTGPYVATNLDSTLSVPCRAAGAPAPHVIWAKDDRYLDTDSRYSIGLDGTLVIKYPSEELSGQYTCVARNVAGNATKTVAVEIYPFFTQMQGDEAVSSVTLVEGSPAAVRCPIHHADDGTVKWYKDAVIISNGTLKFDNVSRQNASAYACVASNAVASAYASVSVVVQWPPRFVESVSEDVQVVQGDDCYFDCRTDAKPKAKVKWYFNSKVVAGEDKDVVKLLGARLRHTGLYKCVVSNGHGTVFRQYTLDVLVPPTISKFDLLDVQLKEGTNATLECDARGSPTPEVTWTFNNTHWTQVNSTLISSSVSAASDGVFACVARNAAGAARLAYRVRVVAAAAVRGVRAYRDGQAEAVHGSLEVALGTSVRVACEASGSPLPSVRWSRHGRTVGENAPGARYADLALTDVGSRHAGLYTCVAANEGGADEETVKIEVLEPPVIYRDVFQTVNSSDNVINVQVLSGQPLYLHCHPRGAPPPDVYWFKEEAPLRLYDASMTPADYGETLAAGAARAHHAGNYTCVARNRVGSASLVYLVDVLVAPPVLKDNVRQVTIHAGSPLELTCPAEGRPPPEVTWLKHPYAEISERSPRVTLLDDNYTLIINSTVTSDSGEYTCVMSNAAGASEAVFAVAVRRAPAFAGGAAVERREVALRRALVLKCDVEGYPAPNITWLKDIQRVSETDAHVRRALGGRVLAVRAVRARDAGQYICLAENEAGSAHRRYDVRVKVPGKWSEWSAWGYCDATCGAGEQARARVCRYVDDDDTTLDKSTESDKIILDESECRGVATDRRTCQMPPCEEDVSSPRWTAWSRWGHCTATCGAGTQARTRRCPRARCVGDNVQIRKCPGLPKCDGRSDNTEPNEVLANREAGDDQDPELPEATFEMQPEVVESHYSPIEDSYVTSAAAGERLQHEVRVTENLDGSARGPCAPGHTYDAAADACHDIDECTIETNQCHATQMCENTLGGYRCTCPAGYVSHGAGQRCLDMNECALGTAGCEYACVNVAGGYVCACPRHLRLHADRRHCRPPSLTGTPLQSQYVNVEENYVSASFEHPAKISRGSG